MKAPFRLYIASPDADALERVFAYAPDFFTVGSGKNAGALEEIRRLSPDLLVMDSVLEGADGAAALTKIGESMPSPPRALFLRRTEAAHAPADAQCLYPADAATLLALAREAADRPVSALARAWEKDREEIAEGLLSALGVPTRMKGYACLRLAVSLCAASTRMPEAQALYAVLAQQLDTTPAAVEKAVRAAVERTWLQGSLAEIQRLFGLSVDAEKGKPTNAECLAMLREHARRALVRRMAEK